MAEGGHYAMQHPDNLLRMYKNPLFRGWFTKSLDLLETVAIFPHPQEMGNDPRGAMDMEDNVHLAATTSSFKD